MMTDFSSAISELQRALATVTDERLRARVLEWIAELEAQAADKPRPRLPVRS